VLETTTLDRLGFCLRPVKIVNLKIQLKLQEWIKGQFCYFHFILNYGFWIRFYIKSLDRVNWKRTAAIRCERSEQKFFFEIIARWRKSLKMRFSLISWKKSPVRFESKNMSRIALEVKIRSNFLRESQSMELIISQILLKSILSEAFKYSVTWKNFEKTWQIQLQKSKKFYKLRLKYDRLLLRFKYKFSYKL